MKERTHRPPLPTHHICASLYPLLVHRHDYQLHPPLSSTLSLATSLFHVTSPLLPQRPPSKRSLARTLTPPSPPHHFAHHFTHQGVAASSGAAQFRRRLAAGVAPAAVPSTQPSAATGAGRGGAVQVSWTEAWVPSPSAGWAGGCCPWRGPEVLPFGPSPAVVRPAATPWSYLSSYRAAGRRAPSSCPGGRGARDEREEVPLVACLAVPSSPILAVAAVPPPAACPAGDLVCPAVAVIYCPEAAEAGVRWCGESSGDSGGDSSGGDGGGCGASDVGLLG